MGGKRTINLVDVTLRDAHQCLWATRMTTAMMEDLALRLDRAGFEAIDLVGGAVFDVCVRYLREDPWERMRILSGWVKQTPLIVMTRGQSLFTFEFFPDDIVELTAERIFANGIRYHTPYDALNDMRNMQVPVRAAKKAGLYTAGGVVYTVSPVHTDNYYARKTRELVSLGVDAVYIKDPSGLLTPERAHTLVPALKAACGTLPLHLHSHCLTGLAPYTACRAVDLAWMWSTQQRLRWPMAHLIQPPNGLSRTYDAMASTYRSIFDPWTKLLSACATLRNARASRSATLLNTMRFTTSIRCRVAWCPI